MVADAVDARLLSNRDPHLFFQQLGEDLGFLAGQTVARAFLTQWAENYQDEVTAIFGHAIDVIPGHPGPPAVAESDTEGVIDS